MLLKLHFPAAPGPQRPVFLQFRVCHVTRRLHHGGSRGTGKGCNCWAREGGWGLEVEHVEVRICWRARQAHSGAGGQWKAIWGAEARVGYLLLESTAESPLKLYPVDREGPPFFWRVVGVFTCDLCSVKYLLEGSLGSQGLTAYGRLKRWLEFWGQVTEI